MLGSTNNIGKYYVYGSTLISAFIVFLIFSILLVNSWEAVTTIGLDLFNLNWNPATREFGIWSMLFGTLVVTFIALLIAVPLGVATAIFTSEILPSTYRIVVKSLLELLAGIPSIIFGLIGIAFFSIWIQNIFDLQSGRTILTAGILLSIMILPTIITLTDDAFNNIPSKYRETAKGLGLYKYEIIKEVLLPIAKPDLKGAILLAFGRALGETMAVMLVIGSIDKIPDPIYNWLSPGQTITSKLGREIAETSFGSVHFSAMIFMGLLLFIIVLILTIISQNSLKSNGRLYE
ncbi:phosphate ABC transporter membrane protein 1 (PhoT family) [Gillisia mitskevichiae]|uniref:Phosphate transport system permease protein n=1 Tax=Gillisia mitskevichiae TaxID=270921 RepID=A0A495P084_9FLAO|nr:phosphate ABC transporter permease subunit PstC [Gillisia mitskevichiae]RKS42828.1 phosphate ABC transporter membrane protein 1 (PhoT family) [Gillisia mitskevichiae]